MECKDIEECFARIEAYCGKPSIGLSLLVNTENDTLLQQIVSRMKLDGNKKCYFLSDTCRRGLFPHPDELHPSEEGCAVVIGYTPYLLLLKDKKERQSLVSDLLQRPTGGHHRVILLSHMADTLETLMAHDLRLSHRIVLLAGERTKLPSIRLVAPDEEYLEKKPLPDIQTLFRQLETYRPEEMDVEYPVKTDLPASLFSHSSYSVLAFAGAYEELVKAAPALSSLDKAWGTKEQWTRFAKEWKEAGSLEGMAQKHFHRTSYFASLVQPVYEGHDDYEKWLLWLLLKEKGSENGYLSFAVGRSREWQDLKEHLFVDLAFIPSDNNQFEEYVKSRKDFIKDQTVNASWVQRYQNEIQKKGKDAISYLFEGSEWESLQLFQCLSDYEYEEKWILRLLENHFPSLYEYMKPFAFTDRQTLCHDLNSTLTRYFDRYKWQKLQNHVAPDFKAWVEELAQEGHRIYNHLQPRTALMQHNRMDFTKSKVYFIDALGVEYISYIQERCKKYGLTMAMQVCHGFLPSITSENTEFMNRQPKPVNVKELDELKHHSTEFDYQKQKLPIHLFKELEAIDKVLESIRDGLIRKDMKQAIIVSDHGATRLAVLCEEENGADFVQGENKGEHGGRCCKVEENPHLPYAAYENGYAILANYSRFKGSRKAEVEVHGGATLEETLVPLIRISLLPENPQIGFLHDPEVVKLKKKEPAQIEITSNFDLAEPRLIVHDKDTQTEYIGDLDRNFRRAVFTLTDIKRRTKDYTADIYDGDKLMRENLPFRVEKEMAKDNFDDLF